MGLLVQCGGHAGPNSSASTGTVSSVLVAPANPSVAYGNTQQFSATVSGTGTVNQAVTWSAIYGTITPSGLYTAPASGTVDTVTATSVQDPAGFGIAPIALSEYSGTVQAIQISPLKATITLGQTQQFSATVLGPGNPSQAVTWTVNDPPPGCIISPTGLFASSIAGTWVITATSIQDPGISGSTTISVVPPPAPFQPNVYWVDDHGNIGCATSDGSSIRDPWIALSIDFDGPFVVDGAYIYYLHTSMSTLGRIKRDGSDRNDHFAGLPITFDMALYGNYLYYLDDWSLGRFDVTDKSKPRETICRLGVSSIFIKANQVYFFWIPEIRSLNPDNLSQKTILRSNAIALSCSSLCVDSTYVYFSMPDSGCIGRVLIDGSNVNLYFIKNVGNAKSLVVGDYIYWISDAGSICRANLDGTNIISPFISPQPGRKILRIALAPTP